MDAHDCVFKLEYIKTEAALFVYVDVLVVLSGAADGTASIKKDLKSLLEKRDLKGV